MERLANLPEWGSTPRELESLGIQEYRQILFQRYRVIYRAMGQRVVIYLIADSKSDMQTLLIRRALTA